MIFDCPPSGPAWQRAHELANNGQWSPRLILEACSAETAACTLRLDDETYGVALVDRTGCTIHLAALSAEMRRFLAAVGADRRAYDAYIAAQEQYGADAQRDRAKRKREKHSRG